MSESALDRGPSIKLRLEAVRVEDARAASRSHKHAILGPVHWASHPETPTAAFLGPFVSYLYLNHLALACRAIQFTWHPLSK